MAEIKVWKLQQLEEVRQQEEEQQKEAAPSRLWKEVVHKAKPIHKCSAVEVKSSELPLIASVSQVLH